MAIDISKIQSIKTASEKQSSGGIMNFMSRDIKLFGSKWNDKKKEGFYGELHVLLTAGIDIRTALELLEGEAEKKRRAINVRTDIKVGHKRKHIARSD